MKNARPPLVRKLSITFRHGWTTVDGRKVVGGYDTIINIEYDGGDDGDDDDEEDF